VLITCFYEPSYSSSMDVRMHYTHLFLVPDCASANNQVLACVYMHILARTHELACM